MDIVVDLTNSDVEDIGTVESDIDDLPPFPSLSALLNRGASSSKSDGVMSSAPNHDASTSVVLEDKPSSSQAEPSTIFSGYAALESPRRTEIRDKMLANSSQETASLPATSDEERSESAADLPKAKRLRKTKEGPEVSPVSGKSRKKRVQKSPDLEKLQKRAEKEQEKQIKKLAREKIRSEKPAACLESMSIILDENLPRLTVLGPLLQAEFPQLAVNSGEFPVLSSLPALVSCYFSYSRLGKLPFPKTIMWTSIELEHNATDSGSVFPIKMSRTEPVVGIVLDLADFLGMARRYIDSDEGETLTMFLNRVKSGFASTFTQTDLTSVRWTLFVEGTEKYFRHLQTIKNRQFRSNVLSVSESQDSQGGKARKPGCPKELRGIETVISRYEMMEAVMDLQFNHDVTIRYAEGVEDMVRFLGAYTKSISELPSKSKKSANREFEVFLTNTGQRGVKFKLNGNGLSDLFRSQLMQLQNLSADIADAITTRYPCARALMDAYDRVADKDGLLENVEVVRGSGVLETRRKIGRVMSRRISRIFNSLDGQESLS